MQEPARIAGNEGFAVTIISETRYERTLQLLKRASILFNIKPVDRSTACI